MRIESLTFLRFVAAVIVVNFHFGGKATGFDGFLISGPQMVSFFFVLSGFVLAYSYGARPKIHAPTFIWARLARLMPIYWLTLGMSIALQFEHGFKFGLDPINLFLNFTLLQSWPPDQLLINHPGWSLSVELFFYLSFPVFLLWSKRWIRFPKMTLLVLIVSWTAIQFAMSEWLKGASANPWQADFPPLHYPNFAIGVLGGLWFKDARWVRSSGVWACAGALISAGLIVLSLNHPERIEAFLGRPMPFEFTFYGPLYLALIISVSASRWPWSDLLSWRPLVLLGESSYALYILQLPIYQAHVLYLRPHMPVAPLTDFLIYLGILIGLSIFLHVYFEKPINAYLRSKAPFFRKRWTQEHGSA